MKETTGCVFFPHLWVKKTLFTTFPARTRRRKRDFLRAKANPSRKKGPGPSSFVLRPRRNGCDETRRDDPTNATPATHGDARDEDGRISVLLFPQTARGRFCLVRRLRASTTPARRRREKRRGAARFSVRFLRPTKEIFQTTFTRLIGFGGLQYIEHTADLDECPSRSRDLRLEDCVTVSRFFYKRAHAGPIPNRLFGFVLSLRA